MDPSGSRTSEPVAARRRMSAWRRTSTPRQLRLGLVVLLVATAAFGIVAVRSITRRLDAARTVGQVASPELTASQDVYVSLADADATASSAFLATGGGSPQSLQRYRDDVDRAAQELPAMAQRTHSVAARNAVTTITGKLPEYTSLVDAAHANSLQAFPVAGAYLHEASQLMRDTILPAATVVYSDAESQLAAADRAGSSPVEVVAVALLAIVLLVLLGLMLVYVARRTRRIVNVGLALALVIVLVLAVASMAAFSHEQRFLQRSQTRGSDPLQILSAARILTLRSFSDENLDLIERGAASDYAPDFDKVAEALRKLTTSDEPGRTYLTSTIRDGVAQYLSLHEAVRAANGKGEYESAVNIAGSSEGRALTTLDDAYRRQLDLVRSRLESDASAARNSLGIISILTVLFTLVAAVAIVLGVLPRIREYT